MPEPFDAFLYWHTTSERLGEKGRGRLEDDIDEWLGSAGEVTGGGSGLTGGNVDIEVTGFDTVEAFSTALRQFLVRWGVPRDAYFTISERRYDVFEHPPLEGHGERYE
jgi:hypothetical protein